MAPYLDFFINITGQRFLPSYLEAEARKWDEIRIRMIDWPHKNSYVITHMCQFVWLIDLIRIVCGNSHVTIRRNTLLLYPSLSPYWRTERLTDRETNLSWLGWPPWRVPPGLSRLGWPPWRVPPGLSWLGWPPWRVPPGLSWLCWPHPDGFLQVYHSNILIWTSTCGSVWYKRNIQNREIQSKRVLGLIKNRHRLADHKKVTQ